MLCKRQKGGRRCLSCFSGRRLPCPGLACLPNRRTDVKEWGSTGCSETMGQYIVIIVAAGVAGWLILLLMCAYVKARERRSWPIIETPIAGNQIVQVTARGDCLPTPEPRRAHQDRPAEIRSLA